MEAGFELLDTGVFEGNRYCDVFVEYATSYGITTSRSSTFVTPGAAQAARSASSRSLSERTVPVSTTTPSWLSTLTRCASTTALRLKALSILALRSKGGQHFFLEISIRLHGHTSGRRPIITSAGGTLNRHQSDGLIRVILQLDQVQLNRTALRRHAGNDADFHREIGRYRPTTPSRVSGKAVARNRRMVFVPSADSISIATSAPSSLRSMYTRVTERIVWVMSSAAALATEIVITSS